MLIPFQPLPFEEVFLVTLGISVVIAFVYRALTKPEEMRKVKKDMEHYKEEAKKAQKAGDREKMNQFMNEQLKASHRMFSLNMKPMLLSMLFFFILLGWLAGQYGGFDVDLQDSPDSFMHEGVEYALSVQTEQVNGQEQVVGINIDDQHYSNNDIALFGGDSWHVVLAGTDIIRFNLIMVHTPFSVPFIGSELNWFWWYIVITVPATMLFRRLLGVE